MRPIQKLPNCAKKFPKRRRIDVVKLLERTGRVARARPVGGIFGSVWAASRGTPTDGPTSARWTGGRDWPGDQHMDGRGSADVLLFEGFRFDRTGGCLFRMDGFGVVEPVTLGSRARAGRPHRAAGAVSYEGRDIRGRLVGNGDRGSQPYRADLGVAPCPRSGSRAGQLHPDYPRSRLPLCAAGDTCRSFNSSLDIDTGQRERRAICR